MCPRELSRLGLSQMYPGRDHTEGRALCAYPSFKHLCAQEVYDLWFDAEVQLLKLLKKLHPKMYDELVFSAALGGDTWQMLADALLPDILAMERRYQHEQDLRKSNAAKVRGRMRPRTTISIWSEAEAEGVQPEVREGESGS